MRGCRLLALAIALSLAAPTGLAAAPDTPETLERIDRAQAAGAIDSDTAARQKIYFLFDREKVEPEFLVSPDLAVKGATHLLHELRQSAGLSAETRAILRFYIDRSAPEQSAAALYDTPGGHFRLSYQTSGPHAVPPADVNPANGIPDFVEKVGGYCEVSWATVIVAMGYPAPPIGAGRYSITLEDLGAGFYGYTEPAGGQLTRIVMDNDFVGFPPNTDPEGSALGAAKVTAAHEFKHASQFVGSGWSEGDWVEADATWIEDLVFDQTNDYYNFITTSQIRFPATPMNPGSYEDCIWQHYMSEKHGVQFVYDVWHRRDVGPAEPMLTTYATIFASYGSSLAAGFGEYLTYAYQCGNRANAQNPGFEEAAAYPSPVVSPTHSTYPVTTGSSSAAAMAGRFVSFINLPNTQQGLRVAFNGQNGVPALRAYLVWATDGGVYARQELALDGNGDGEFTTPAVADLQFVTLVAGNGGAAGSATFTYTAELVSAAAIAEPEPVAALAPAGLAVEPNPFNPATVLRYRIADGGFVRLAVHDAGGRLVRVLVAESEEPGEHRVAWDGRDGAGRSLPSGAYFVRLEAAGQSAVQKLTLVK